MKTKVCIKCESNDIRQEMFQDDYPVGMTYLAYVCKSCGSIERNCKNISIKVKSDTKKIIKDDSYSNRFNFIEIDKK